MTRLSSFSGGGQPNTSSGSMQPSGPSNGSSSNSSRSTDFEEVGTLQTAFIRHDAVLTGHRVRWIAAARGSSASTREQAIPLQSTRDGHPGWETPIKSEASAWNELAVTTPSRRKAEKVETARHRPSRRKRYPRHTRPPERPRHPPKWTHNGVQPTCWLRTF